MNIKFQLKLLHVDSHKQRHIPLLSDSVHNFNNAQKCPRRAEVSSVSVTEDLTWTECVCVYVCMCLSLRT